MKIRELADRHGWMVGCQDHSCVFGGPNGMGTNGGCQCTKHLRTVEDYRLFVKTLLSLLGDIADGVSSDS